MIRLVVEMPGNDPDAARRELLAALEKGAPAPEGYWHVRLKEFERVRAAVNKYENDPTIFSQLQIAIRDAFTNIAGYAP